MLKQIGSTHNLFLSAVIGALQHSLLAVCIHVGDSIATVLDVSVVPVLGFTLLLWLCCHNFVIMNTKRLALAHLSTRNGFFTLTLSISFCVPSDMHCAWLQKASVATERVSATLNAGQSVVLTVGLTAVLAMAAAGGTGAGVTAGDLVCVSTLQL